MITLQFFFVSETNKLLIKNSLIRFHASFVGFFFQKGSKPPYLNALGADRQFRSVLLVFLRVCIVQMGNHNDYANINNSRHMLISFSIGLQSLAKKKVCYFINTCYISVPSTT